MVVSMTQDEKGPIIDICIVADKARCPLNYEVISRAYDDPSTEADVWKDGFFAFSRVLRYICISRSIPKNAFVCNVVADLAITNAGDIVPSGFAAIEFCADSKSFLGEKALRKKQLCIRTMPRESAVDAVNDVIVLAKLKKPPTGYSLAGEVDGLLICYKYGTIPADFPGVRPEGAANVYPNLPYPIHPLSHATPNQPIPGTPTEAGGYQRQSAPAPVNAAGYSTLDRQYSVAAKLGIEGVPFELSHLLTGNDNQRRDLPYLKPASADRLESEFNYEFLVEQTVLDN